MRIRNPYKKLNSDITKVLRRHRLDGKQGPTRLKTKKQEIALGR